MAENKMLSLFPVLAFCIGVIIKSIGIIYENDMSTATLGSISILALAFLMLVFNTLGSRGREHCALRGRR